MKHLVCLFLLISPMLALAQSFRNTHWGANGRQVVTSEPRKPTSITENYIWYNPVDTAGANLKVEYRFNANKLTSAIYTSGVPVADSLKFRSMLTDLVNNTIIDMGEPKSWTGDISATRITFVSANGSANFLYGLIDGNRYFLIAGFLPPKKPVQALKKKAR